VITDDELYSMIIPSYPSYTPLKKIVKDDGLARPFLPVHARVDHGCYSKASIRNDGMTITVDLIY